MEEVGQSKTPFELLIAAASSRLPIPSKVTLLIKRYYTSHHVLPINMWIAYNYTSSVHEMSFFNVVHDVTETFKVGAIPRCDVITNALCQYAQCAEICRPIITA